MPNGIGLRMIDEQCSAFTDPYISSFPIHEREGDHLWLFLSLPIVASDRYTRNPQKPTSHACFFCGANSFYSLNHFEKDLRSQVFCSRTIRHTGCNIAVDAG